MSKSYYKNRIAWARWEVQDAFNPEFFTAYTVSVYKPSYDYQHVSVLYSMANGGGKCFMRYKSLKQLQAHHVIPEQYLERLHTAETYAWECLGIIKEDVANLGKIKKGAKIVDLDTGEILNDAERIIRDNRD